MDEKVRVLLCPVINGLNTEKDIFVPGVGIIKKDGKYTKLGRQYIKEQIEILEMIIVEIEAG